MFKKTSAKRNVKTLFKICIYVISTSPSQTKESTFALRAFSSSRT